MNSCERHEKINIEFLKELVRSGKYDKKQFEDKLRQGETWASAMRYFILHAHEPKVYTKGRNRSDVYIEELDKASNGTPHARSPGAHTNPKSPANAPRAHTNKPKKAHTHARGHT